MYQSREEKEAALPLISSKEIKKMKIDDGKSSVTLEKKGETWQLSDCGGVVVDAKKVEALLSTLSKISLQRPVVTNQKHHRRLKVASNNFKRHITFAETGEGFYLGSYSEARLVHLRPEKSDKVYQVKSLTEWDFPSRNSDWVESLVIDLRKNDLDLFILKTPSNRFEFSKKEEHWNCHTPPPEGKEFDESSFGIWLNQQASWRLVDVVSRDEAPSHGFDKAWLKLTFSIPHEKEVSSNASPDLSKEAPSGKNQEEEGKETKGAEERSKKKKIIEKEIRHLLIGAKVPGKEEHYAKLTGINFIFTVGKKRVDDLLGDLRKSFYRDIEKEMPSLDKK
jgi:hypothetical protein